MVIKYPVTINTNEEKREFLYRSREKLRLEHNEKGRQFREEEISESQWLAYKATFSPKNMALSEAIAPLQHEKVLSNGGYDRLNTNFSFKEQYKKSTKHDSVINLGDLVK